MKGFKVQDVFSWRQAAFIGGMHVLALFHISILGLVMLFGLHFLTGCIGFSVGYLSQFPRQNVPQKVLYDSVYLGTAKAVGVSLPPLY